MTETKEKVLAVRAGASEIGIASRLLIVRVGAMGDVLHALPAVSALRNARPDVSIGWAIEPRWSPLLQSAEGSCGKRSVATPLVDGWHAVNAALWKRAGISLATAADIRVLRTELRARDFDLCVDLQGSIRSAVVGRLAGTRRFVGSASPRELPARFLYGERVEIQSTHVVEQACDLLGHAVGLPLRPAEVELPRSSAAELWAASVTEDAGRTVLLAPTAGWGAKEWPPERFGALAAALVRGGFQVLVNVASEADETGLRVVLASGGKAQLAACSIGQLIALTRRCSLVIAGDTGPLHLAAALNIPVVGLYGPTNPARTGPWATRSILLRDLTSVTDHKRHTTIEAGLLRIDVEQVVSAALELLGDE